MRTFDISPNTHPVSDFLQWQRDGTLNLTPEFQRRAVWGSGAASYLIDTVVRGLPVPLIFLRQRLELSSQRMIRDVVDGQQRLRTLFAYIDPTSLPDFDPSRDQFTVKKTHNLDLAGKPFSKLDGVWQSRILGYKFSVLTLPTDIEDRDVLQIFARINSTGLSLNHQELRNARFFGVYKTLMYNLSYEQLERWQKWKLFSGDQLSRMSEVELTSDLAMAMLSGLSGKTKKKLDDLYEMYDEACPFATELTRRFRIVMDVIEETVGRSIAGSVFDREMHFYSLFLYVYDRLWGLGTSMKRTPAGTLTKDFAVKVLEVSQRFKEGRVPPKVLDSVARAATDLGRRRTRYNFTASVIDAKLRS